jgi:hypothetical protein
MLGRLLIAVGSLATIAGIIFALQGFGVLGGIRDPAAPFRQRQVMLATSIEAGVIFPTRGWSGCRAGAAYAGGVRRP